jgi:hypothetical protein
VSSERSIVAVGLAIGVLNRIVVVGLVDIGVGGGVVVVAVAMLLA